jgi:hypothetical protein
MPCCKEQTSGAKPYDKDGVVLHEDEVVIVEPLEDIGEKIKNTFNGIGDKLRDVGEDIKNQTEQTANTIKDGAEKNFNAFGDKVVGGFNDATNRIKRLGNGLEGIFDGIGQMFRGMFDGIGDGFNDIGTLFRYFGVYLQSNLFCGVKFLRNFTHCFMYYVIDAFLRTLYSPIEFSFWLAKYGFNTDMQYLEDLIWKYLWMLDGYVYSATKYHILMWPTEVRNDCYNCVRLKSSAMERIAHEVDDDFRNGIKAKMTTGIDKIKSSADDIKSAFT